MVVRYNGKDLKNAACYDRNGYPSYDATVHDMIGAMVSNKYKSFYFATSNWSSLITLYYSGNGWF